MITARKNQPYDTHFKLIIIGDTGVGKTNLLTFFCEGVFKQNYVATIGVDFKIKMMSVDHKKVKLQIWDTAGQQRFRNLTQTYYKGAQGIILVYSISEARTFDNLSNWIKQIEVNSTQGVTKMLVGSKYDLNQERQVSYQKGKQLADKHSMQFFQVSSKTSYNVHECFEALARQLKQKRQLAPKNVKDESHTITVSNLKKNKQKEKKCWC